MINTAQKKSLRPSTLTLILFILLICFNPFVIVNAGERGVLLQFGEVQEKILGEGLHAIIPVVHTVKKLSVRIQKHEISAEASTKDLQEVFTDVALNWHIIPERVNIAFQQIGNENEVINRIINPAVEEVLKAVMAQFTAEEIITKRGDAKAAVDELLTERLTNYYIAVDDISLVHVHFSERFRDAVEAKQIAEQEAKKAGFMTIKTLKQAEATVNLARGEAEAYRLLHETLTPDILHKEMINKWDGNLPLIIGNDAVNLLDLEQLVQTRIAASK